jgi:hypothetical protein
LRCRATAGVAATLEAGGLAIADNHIHHVAQHKRTYMPGKTILNNDDIYHLICIVLMINIT